MSRAHTKRRKLIASLKRKHRGKGFERKWHEEFDSHRAACLKLLDGPLLGTLEDLMNLNRETA